MKYMYNHKILSDKDIVDGLLANDERIVYYLFYEKCSVMFSYIIKSIFKYHIDRDELISELYIYLKRDDWHKVRNFNYQSKFTTWLSVVAVRFFIQRRGSLIDYTSNIAPVDMTTIPDIESTTRFDLFIDKIDLYTAINKLTNPRERFALFAIDIEGRDEEDVAIDLGVSVANLYNIKSRAKKHLSTILKEKNYVD